MPVKVKCKGCEKVLTAPDKLRGKTVKCPQCKSPLKIPTGKKRPAGSAEEQPRRRRPKPAPEPDYDAEPDDLFGGLDLGRAEDRNTKLCPKCATEVDPDDLECLNCGVNIATGVLSAKQRTARTRKGPDPAEYWGKIWSDGWTFTKNHWALALKTGGMFVFLLAMTICASRTMNWCYEGYITQILEEAAAEARITATSRFEPFEVIADGPKSGTVFLGKTYIAKSTPFSPPAMMAAYPLNNPPFVFWWFMTNVLSLALGGLFWFVGTNIVRVTMDGKKKIRELQGDFFSYISLGIKGATWPLILWAPVVWFIVIPLTAIFPPLGLGLAFLLALLTMPMYAVCMVHFCQAYVYKAYLIVPMVRITMRNFMPAAYWAISAFAVNMVMVITSVVCMIMSAGILGYYRETLANASAWISANVYKFEGEWGQFTFYELPVLFMSVFIVFLPIALATGFSTMFMMRGIGLFGRYYRDNLELMNESIAGAPCGFGPRYLAAIVDVFMIPLTAVLVASNRLLQMINLFTILILVVVLVTFPPEIKAIAFPVILVFAIIMMVWTYYAVQESGYEQCTTGKNAQNLIVVDMEGNRITLQAATKRLAAKFLSALPFFGGYFMAAFNVNKQALHDTIAKTQVVWRGESEQSRL